jgi:hypothetical protein
LDFVTKKLCDEYLMLQYSLGPFNGSNIYFQDIFRAHWIDYLFAPCTLGKCDFATVGAGSRVVWQLLQNSHGFSLYLSEICGYYSTMATIFFRLRLVYSLFDIEKMKAF